MVEAWTVETVADRFVDAARTARRLPRVMVQGYGASGLDVSDACGPFGELPVELASEEGPGPQAGRDFDPLGGEKIATSRERRKEPDSESAICERVQKTVRDRGEGEKEKRGPGTFASHF